jgi:hypothetical protein
MFQPTTAEFANAEKHSKLKTVRAVVGAQTRYFKNTCNKHYPVNLSAGCRRREIWTKPRRLLYKQIYLNRECMLT